MVLNSIIFQYRLCISDELLGLERSGIMNKLFTSSPQILHPPTLPSPTQNNQLGEELTGMEIISF